MRRKYLILMLILVLTACASRLPASYYSRETTYALVDTSNTRLGKVYALAVKNHPGQSGFHLLPSGPEALMMRIALIEASQRTIDLQYFSTREDTTGKLLLEAISRAADRGVRVRMLLDGWGLDEFESGAVALNAHPNIEIRVFNPYSSQDESFLAHFGNTLFDLYKFTRRMHNKAIIADSQISIMGGRNLGDEYFDANEELAFQDIDVFCSGPITQQLSKSFDNYWNSEESFPVSSLNIPPPDAGAIAQLHKDTELQWQKMMISPIGKRLRRMPLPREVKGGEVPLVWAKAELAVDSPDKINQSSETSVSKPEIDINQMVSHAEHELMIFTPYFVPLDAGVGWLTALVARGVNVRIVTNSLSSTDMVSAQAGYGHYREALVRGGVELYEIKSTQPKHSIKSMFKPSSQNGLHAKIFMVDRKVMAIGSFNFDPRSLRLNTEQMLIIHSSELGAEVARLFKEVTLPAASYQIILADTVPADQKRTGFNGPLAWKTEENGAIVYYDLSPHAGFWRNLMDHLFSILPFDEEL